MKAVNKWSFRPYTEMYKPERGSAPYICRLAPREAGFTVDFIDNAADSSCLVWYAKRGESDFTAIRPDKIEDKEFEIFTASVECDDLTDYEVYAERGDGVRSSVRLVRTGYVPGTVVNYLHPEDNEYSFSGHYLCSPSIIHLKSGRLLASMDVFAGNLPQNLTLIYKSDDDGRSWQYLTELFPCFWGKMFYSGDDLYMLGVSREYGDVLIGRSDDNGESWTMPTVLFRGSNFSGDCGLHRAPMPVEISHGRVMTDIQYGAWAKHIMCDAVMSAPEHSDLTNPDNWVCSGFWNPQQHADVSMTGPIGGIEGNVITAPDGTVYDFLRYWDGKALILKFDPSEPERELEFVSIIDFPATASKFDIIFDEKTGLYVSLVSYFLHEPRTQRNLLSLIYSPDLFDWKLGGHIIDYRDADRSKIAFQYVDFTIDGDDILLQSRTAFNGAKSFHDNNFSTFHKIESFRNLLK